MRTCHLGLCFPMIRPKCSSGCLPRLYLALPSVSHSGRNRVFGGSCIRPQSLRLAIRLYLRQSSIILAETMLKRYKPPWTMQDTKTSVLRKPISPGTSKTSTHSSTSPSALQYGKTTSRTGPKNNKTNSSTVQWKSWTKLTPTQDTVP